jgi:hypothetical protein
MPRQPQQQKKNERQEEVEVLLDRERPGVVPQPAEIVLQEERDSAATDSGRIGARCSAMIATVVARRRRRPDRSSGRAAAGTG